MKNLSTLAVLASLCSIIAAVPAPSSPFSRRSECPANSDLPDGTISPYALVQIAKSQPDHAFGMGKEAKVTPGDFCTIVDLKIPDFYNGESTLLKTCTLIFDFPDSSQSPHLTDFSGPGHFTFTGYLTGFGGDDTTTYNKQPVPGPSPPSPPPVMVPGNSYVVADLPCLIPPLLGPQTVSGALCSDDTTLEFEQTDVTSEGGCPLGFFVYIH